MEIIIFFAFIAVCAIALVWASRKTKSEKDLEHKKRVRRNKSRADKLIAPADNLLAHKEEVWLSRRHHATTGVEHTNKFVPKSEDTGTPEYDGFSRRDRHHVRERTAQVKEDRDGDSFTMTAVEYHADEKASPKKAAS